MNITRTVLAFAFVASGWAQSVSITAPAVSQTIAGTTSFLAQVSISSAPNACIVQYKIDGESIGYSRIEVHPDFSVPFDPYDIGNGTHTIQAVLLDCLQVSIATSPAVSFTILNTNLVNSQLSVSCTTSPSSPWSGMVHCTATATNSPPGLKYFCYIDGIATGNDDNTTTCAFPTISFVNGSHPVVIAATANNTLSQKSNFAIWEQQIIFSNGAAHQELRVGSREAYISPGGTLQLATPVIANTDGTVSAVTTVEYDSATPATCTISNTGLLTGVAFGLCDYLVVSSNPALDNFLAASGQPISANSINFDHCVTHPPMPFYIMVDAEIELVSPTGMNCSGTPNPNAGVVRAQFGTTAVTHANNAPGVVLLLREAYAYVSTDNAILNWTTAGTIVSNWHPGSFWMNSAFTGGTNYFFPAQEPTVPASVMGPLIKQAYNAMEFDAIPGGCSIGVNNTGGGGYDCSTQAAMAASMNTYIGLMTNQYLGPFGLYNHPQLNSQINTNSGIYANVVKGSTFSPSAYQTAMQAWQNSGLAIGSWGVDEVDRQYAQAQPQAVINAAGPFTGMTCNGTICTVSYSGHPMPANASNHFCIFGATTNSALNCTIGGAIYSASNIDSGHFSFPSSVVTTVTSASDPTIRLEPFVYAWQNNNADYVPYTVFRTLFGQLSLITPARIPFTNPVQGSDHCPSCDYQWMGDPTISDFARVYSGCGAQSYTPRKVPAYSQVLCASTGSQGIRQVWGNLQSNRLLMPLTTSFTNVYYPTPDASPPAAIVSITNETVIFAAPHGIYNIVPGVTRAVISGTTNAYYNTDWIIDSCPTATACTISRRRPNTTGATYNELSSTITFQNGDTATISKLVADSGQQSNNVFFYPGTPTCATVNHRGTFFTLTFGGSLPAYFAGGQRFIYAAESSNCINLSSTVGIWREVPTSQSATGGSALLLPDNNWINGRNIPASGNPSIFGPRLVHANIMEYAALGVSSEVNWGPGGNHTAYSSNGAPDGLATGNLSVNPPFRMSEIAGGLFAGAHPYWEDGTGALEEYYAQAVAQSILTSPHITKCLFQPRAPAPDLGTGVESTVRSGAQSKCIMAVNQTDVDKSVTVDMTSLQTGQPILQMGSSWTGLTFATLAANTTINTVTIPAGGSMFWIAPVIPDSFQEPTIGTRLADVPNAAKVVVEWACTPYPFTQLAVDVLPQVVDLGTGVRTLPVDRATCATLRYRLRYLSSSGAPLATSDIQQ